MKTAHRSTFGQKLARYPVYLRLQLQRRWLTMSRLLRLDRPAAKRPARTIARVESGGSDDGSRPPRISQNWRIWIFATVTGTVAIIMLVFQISATLKENARLAAIEAAKAEEQQTTTDTPVPEPVDTFNLFTADAHQHDAAHENHEPSFSDAPAEATPAPVPAEDMHRDKSPFALLPPYSKDGGNAKHEPHDDFAVTEQHEPLSAPPVTLPAPEPAKVEPADIAPLANSKDESFQSFDKPNASSSLDVDNSKPASEPIPAPTPVIDTPDTTIAPQLDAKVEPDPFAEAPPTLGAPEAAVQPAPVELVTPKTPDDFTDDSLDAKAPEPTETPATTPALDPPVAAPVQPSIEAPTSEPEAAPAQPEPDVSLDVPKLDLDTTEHRDEPPVKAPATEELVVPVPAKERPAPVLDRIEPVDPKDTETKTPEPDRPAAPKSDTPNWSSPDPARDKSLVNPNLYLERQPAWRLVAPLATNGDPNETLSANSQCKELNITIVKTTPKNSAVREILSYEIIVRNNSQESVDGLILEERVPESLQVADVTPRATFEKGTLRWLLSSIGAGEQRKLEINLLPTQSGLAESITTARAMAAVSSNTDVQHSHLQIDVSSGVGHCGQVCPINYRVTNTGREPLNDLVLRTVLPGQLSHQKGHSLDLMIGRLEPGESRDARLHPLAQTAGTAIVRASIIVAGDSVHETSANVHVAGPVSELAYPKWPSSVGQ